MNDSQYLQVRGELEAGLQGRLTVALKGWWRSVYPSLADLKKQAPPVDWKTEQQRFYALLLEAMLWGSTMLSDAEMISFSGISYDPADLLDRYERAAQGRLANIALTTTRQTLAERQAWTANKEPTETLVERAEKWYGAARAQRIATTETSFLLAADALQVGHLIDSHRWEWVHVGPDDPCETFCAPFVGQVFSMLDAMPPHSTHVGCLLPENKVTVAGLVAAAKSFYDGRCVEIDIENGSKLTVTPNHPILTPRGWVPAQFLCEGEDVIVARDAEGIMAGVDPDHEHIPSEIEQVFRSFEESGAVLTRAVPATAEDLHGDGGMVDGNINIVYADCLLGSDRQIERLESLGQDSFDGRDVRLLPLGRSSPEFTFGQSMLSSRRCRVGSLRDLLPVGRGGLGHPQGISSSAIPWRDAFSFKAASDSAARDAILARDFILRFASQITTNPIRHLRFFNYRGHVYDLQSEMMQLYSGSSIIVKNCHCLPRPLAN